MALFDCEDYRSYLRTYLKGLPKKGRGELSKIALHLKTNSTLLSQVFAGTRHFSAEQTYELSCYLGHSSIETDYFCTFSANRKSRKSCSETALPRKAESAKAGRLEALEADRA